VIVLGKTEASLKDRIHFYLYYVEDSELKDGQKISKVIDRLMEVFEDNRENIRTAISELINEGSLERRSKR